MGKLAHGIAVKFPVGFDSIVQAIANIDIASNVFGEIYSTKPRIAVFVGEKYYFRAKSGLVATTIVVESSQGTIVKVITSGGRESFIDFFDLGASKSYAHKIIDELSKKLGVQPTIIAEVNRLDYLKAKSLHGM